MFSEALLSFSFSFLFLFFFFFLFFLVWLLSARATFRTLAEDGRGQEQKQDDRDERNELVLSKLQTTAKNHLTKISLSLTPSSSSNSSILAHLSLGQMVSRIRRAPRAPTWEERDKTKVLDGTLFYV